ncbi:MAG: hypothetical protein LBG64_03800 [Pseudomonadales bacterium]|nr:hypothetical protein [Pseudomonadales bacterium]
MKKIILPIIVGAICIGAFFGGYFFHSLQSNQYQIIEELDCMEYDDSEPYLPLNRLSIPSLSEATFEAGSIQFERVTEIDDDYLGLIFTFITEGKTMSGLTNIPILNEYENVAGTILMIRGWVPQHNFVSGTGTRNAGVYLARNNFQTFAPDFLGHGDSDPSPACDWQ